MEKKEIKNILREGLMGFVKENEPKKDNEGTPKRDYEKEYADVQNKLDGTMLKQSQVMSAAGLGDPNDATDRSLFSKKVRREKNDDGSFYLFSDEELASVIKVLNNPSAFLSVKKGG